MKTTPLEGGKTTDREIAVICEVGRGWICGKGLNQRKYVRWDRTGFKCFSSLAHQERGQSPSNILAYSGKDLY